MILLTHSLLSSWLWLLKDEWSEDPMADFMTVLNREPTPATPAMQDGIDFEDLVTDIINGERAEDLESPWFNAAAKVARRCEGGLLQYKASKPIKVDDVDILLYGRLDCLNAGEIIDIKFSRRYERGKYFSSTQHPVYMELVPEAEIFTYMISNGTDVWQESYRRDETQSIYPVIRDFLKWLRAMGLYETYKDKWRSKEG